MRMASIHHHFPNKEALRKALIDSYPERITHVLDRQLNPTEYREFFVCCFGDELMPLCGVHADDAVLFLLTQKLEQIFRAEVTD